jgi:hypothetical protein
VAVKINTVTSFFHNNKSNQQILNNPRESMYNLLLIFLTGNIYKNKI